MSYEYKVQGRTVALDIDPNLVAVKFQDPSPNSVRNSAVDAAGAGPFSKRFEIPGEKLTLGPAKGTSAPRAGSAHNAIAKQAIDSLNKQPEVEQALPVFRLNGNQVVATERVIIGLQDPAKAEPFGKAHGLTLLSQFDDKAVYSIKPGSNPFDICAALDGQQGVRFAEPDLITIGRHIPKRVAPAAPSVLSDPLTKDQYAIKLTRADKAWKEQPGKPKIKIAILDEGVDTNHPDLKSAITGTYDSADNDSYQEPNPWDGHGTSCAGLAAAVGDNSIGVRGVGSGCSLMAVRIAYSAYSGGPWVISNEMIARAINWSRINGADVIRNRWGGGAPSNSIIDEFDRAMTLGRKGKGCVVVAAAGNSFTSVHFPGNMQNVLTVSASNEFDEAKIPTSKDGENWWGTCFGPEIDVAAPGVHNITTDISGSSGYTGGDYVPNFNGTSSSTPIVAGACGLILSANPNLTQAEVCDIIRKSAAKVGPYPYVNERNDYFGHGRLDVLSAIKMTKKTIPAPTEAKAEAVNVS